MNLIWSKALKQAVASISAVLLTNIVDPNTQILTWPWAKHMLIAMFFLTLINEARYWQEWAGTEPPGPTGGTMNKLGGVAGMFAVIALAIVGLTGCNAYKAANATLNTIGDIFTIAQNDLPALEANGTIPAKDVPGVTGWLAAGQLLKTQAQTCVTAAGTSAKASALGACLVTFATGLTSPAELADIRVLSKGSQAKIELWATGFVLTANGFCVVEGCSTTPVPIIQSTTAPTAEELHDLRIRAGISDQVANRVALGY